MTAAHSNVAFYLLTWRGQDYRSSRAKEAVKEKVTLATEAQGEPGSGTRGRGGEVSINMGRDEERSKKEWINRNMRFGRQQSEERRTKSSYEREGPQGVDAKKWRKDAGRRIQRRLTLTERWY